MSMLRRVSVAQIATLLILTLFATWWVVSIEKTIDWWATGALVGPMGLIGLTVFTLFITLSSGNKLILIEYVLLLLATGVTYWFVSYVLPDADWASLGRVVLGAIILISTTSLGVRIVSVLTIPPRGVGIEKS